MIAGIAGGGAVILAIIMGVLIRWKLKKKPEAPQDHNPNPTNVRFHPQELMKGNNS